MSKYIDADKARDNSTDPYVRIYLDSQPTADVAPVVHGHWIYLGRSEGSHLFKCSKCSRYALAFRRDIKGHYPYCHCGAKMDEEVEE